MQKRREWTTRNLHELQDYKDKALFVTLTYKSNCATCNAVKKQSAPMYMSLRKEHLQVFMKRLRKKLDPKNYKQAVQNAIDYGCVSGHVRYYACGEYGDQEKRPPWMQTIPVVKERPHYHLIIYGIGWESRKLIMDCWKYADWNQKKIVKGSFGFVTPESIQYVCQYIDKKFIGENATWEYDVKGREPVFKLQSQGIGRQYVLKHQDKIINDMYVYDHKSRKQSVPRYYLNKMDLTFDQERRFKQESKKQQKISEGETTAKYTGIHATNDGLYQSDAISNDTKIKYVTKKRQALEQHDKNLKAWIDLRKRNLSSTFAES